MIQVITTKQLAEELNRKIKDGRYYNNCVIYFQDVLIDLATAIDEQTIRLDFHWSEQHRPVFVEYATEEWVVLTDEVDAFVLLKKLNTEMLQYSQSLHEERPNQAQYILELQSELLELGYETIIHHQYTENDRSQNKSRGRFYYTVEREKK